MDGFSLADLVGKPIWVAWANEERDDGLTKIPFAPKGGFAKADDPATWGNRRDAEVRAKRVTNGLRGGIGIILGTDCGDGTALGGIDLDTCRSTAGAIEAWATEVIDRFASYAEVSPSLMGAKVFFRYRTADLPHVRQIMGTSHGRMFKRAGGKHPPAIELHVSNRYFTVTGDVIDPDRVDLQVVEVDDLKWLLTEHGPAFAGKAQAGEDRSGTRSAPRDQSRSGAAFRLGMRMRREGADFGAFREALETDPATADWYREKGASDGERELHRIWEKVDDGLPTIQLAIGERPRIIAEAIDALEAAAAPLYRRGLSIVNVAKIPAKTSDGSDIVTPSIVTVLGQQLVHELGKAAHWTKFDGRRKEWVPSDVPGDIAAKVAALPNEWLFRPLAGIAATQTMRRDGSLLTEPGYDAATAFLLFDPPAMPTMPESPTKAEAEAALDLLDRLLDEFPFAFDPDLKKQHSQADNPSRSVALSMLMTPVLRPALAPAVPLHVVQKPAGGSGGSYLCDLAAALATGERCPVLTKSPSAEETEKRLVGAIMTGQPIISVDNCNGDLRSEFLCQAIERPRLQVRALGSSELAHIANAVTCFANGNNIVVAADLVRRTIQCRLDANVERPELRRFERDPLARLLARRGRYVRAVLTLARAYVVAGKPNRPPPFASFDSWNDLVRGSLLWLGCADPCETIEDLAVADPVKNERAEVFQTLAPVLGDRAAGHTVSEIIASAKEAIGVGNDGAMDVLMTIAEDRDSGKISPKRLGKWLSASQNAIAGGYKLQRNDTDKSRTRWRFAPVEAPRE